MCYLVQEIKSKHSYTGDVLTAQGTVIDLELKTDQSKIRLTKITYLVIQSQLIT